MSSQWNDVNSIYIVNFTMRSKLVVVNDRTSIDVISVSNEFLVLKAKAEYFHTWFDNLSAIFSEVLFVFSPIDERKTRLRL